MHRMTGMTGLRRAAAGALTAVLMAAGAVALAPAAQAAAVLTEPQASEDQRRAAENRPKSPVGTAAARSTKVKLINDSGTNLVKTWDELAHGCWTTGMLPPDNVPSSGHPMWQSESCGFMTGTEGKVTYAIAGGGEIRLHWKNPFVGSNSYSCSVPAPYQCSRQGGGGNNAEVTFHVWKNPAMVSKTRAASGTVPAVNAARSTYVSLTNASGSLLTRTNAQLHWGIWSTNMLPPSIVQPGVTGKWMSESDGFMTGTEGEVTFSLVGASNPVKVHWNNPYWGSNSYSCSAPDGYTCTWQGGGGNNATVSFTLSKV
jgi:hypothetical protein